MVARACRQCCNAGCRYHGRHGERSCRGCNDAAQAAIRAGNPPACAECGFQDKKGRVDEQQTRQFFCKDCWASYQNDRLKEFFDEPNVLESKCIELAELIANAKHCIAFTGAGVSTGAGVPDFRSGHNTVLPTGPGLWEIPKSDRPKGNILDSCMQAKAGRTHQVLSSLWKAGLLKFVISQNVDGLHRRSGLPKESLAELHGNLYVERCDHCGAEHERNFNVISSARYSGRTCELTPGCRGPLRDSGIRFGDDLPKVHLERSWRQAESCDLCLALGSSITVTPASDIPAWIGRRQKGKRSAAGSSRGGLVIVNLQATPCDGDATLRVNGFVDDVMDRVAKILVKKGVLSGEEVTVGGGLNERPKVEGVIRGR